MHALATDPREPTDLVGELCISICRPIFIFLCTSVTDECHNVLFSVLK